MCATCGCGSSEVRMTSGVAHQHDHHHDQDHDHDHDHDHDDPHALLRPAPRSRSPPTARLSHDLPASTLMQQAPPRGRSSSNRICWPRTTPSRRTTGAGWSSGRSSRSICSAARARARPACSSAPSASWRPRRSRCWRAIRTPRTTPIGCAPRGPAALQINTGRGCHLDAAMIRAGLNEIAPARGSLLFVENVGNLVCPALFDLGERAKVVLLSVTEGEDKPLKYPHAFRSASVLVLSQDRSAAPPRLRPRALPALRTPDQPAAARLPAVRPRRRRHGRVVRLASLGAGRGDRTARAERALLHE